MLGAFLRSSLRIACTAPTTSSASRSATLGHLEQDDRALLLAIGEVDVEVQAAALERVGHLARVVAGEDDERDVLAP